jgi:large subunit ribosomal protein L24
MIKTMLKKNDNVVVVTGKDRGKRGKVLYIDRKKGRLVIEGINKKKKYVKPSQQNPKGGAISLEYPVQLSNIMAFCDKCKKGVRLGVELKDKSKVRICRKCGKNFG